MKPKPEKSFRHVNRFFISCCIHPLNVLLIDGTIFVQLRKTDLVDARVSIRDVIPHPSVRRTYEYVELSFPESQAALLVANEER